MNSAEERVRGFSEPKEGWVDIALSLLSLPTFQKNQPEVSPAEDGGVRLWYAAPKGNYLEFTVCEDGILVYEEDSAPTNAPMVGAVTTEGADGILKRFLTHTSH